MASLPSLMTAYKILSSEVGEPFSSSSSSSCSCAGSNCSVRNLSSIIIRYVFSSFYLSMDKTEVRCLVSIPPLSKLDSWILTRFFFCWSVSLPLEFVYSLSELESGCFWTRIILKAVCPRSHEIWRYNLSIATMNAGAALLKRRGSSASFVTAVTCKD